MSKPIDRIRAKITRAKQHIQDFHLGLRAFYDTKPYTIGIKEKPEIGKRIYYVTKVDCVPDALTAIAADVIQNLRSPLDHIAYQLVLDARSGTKPDWTVYYPISGSAAQYPATRGGKIKGVRQEVIDAIDATEPYKGGKGHALWQLNELNKPDKHQILVLAGSIVSVDIAGLVLRQRPVDEFQRLWSSLPPMFFRGVSTAPIDVGYEILIDSIDRKVADKERFKFDVAIYEPGVIEPHPALKTLQDMANLVDDIVTQLGRFLR